jgi:signal transduction histidine kinase/dsRNA-specific ribonuclease
MTFPVVLNEWNIEPTIEALVHCGLPVPVNHNIHNALLIALSHESFFYEHAREMPDVTAGFLTALSSLGKAFVHRRAVVHLYHHNFFDRPGPLSERISHISSSFPSWAGNLQWLNQSVALSKGLDRSSLPRRVPAIVCGQLIGALCLADKESVAAQLVADLIAYSSKEFDRSKFDPRTLLLEALGRTALDTRVEQCGPDHASTFKATLTDSRGRRSIGEGPSKKQAIRVASVDFLQRYLPNASAKEKAGARVAQARIDPLPVEGHAYEGHMISVQRLRDLFELPASASALLSQALIHPSWTYENQDTVARTRQQDNQVLGLFGSHVLIYEHALRAVSATLQSPPKEFTFLTLEHESYERAFYHLGLANGLLLGQGQRSVGVSAEMAANAFQATMAAVFIEKRCPASLLADWPENLSRLRDIAIPDVLRPKDSVTILQEICAASQLTNEYSSEVSGPTHHQSARATLILGSHAMGRRIKIIGGSVSGGKKPAKQEVATTALETIDTLSDAESILKLADSNGDDLHLAVFLLTHFAAAAPDTETLTRKWMSYGLFGTHLAKTPKALSEWARGADGLLERQKTVTPDIASMTRLFRSAMTVSADQSSPLRGQLAHTLEWLNGIDRPEHIEERHVSQLELLCNLYRAIGSDVPDIEARTLTDDWKLLYGERVQVNSFFPRIVLTDGQRAALDSLTSLLLKQGSNLTIEVEDGTRLHIRIIADGSINDEQIASACSLWSAANPMLDLAPIECGVDAALTIIDAPDEVGPVLRSVVAASRPVPEPYSNAVADLLHDLKNQMIAARQAPIAPSANRTARLAQQAAASAHLDQAVAMGRRLGAVASLLGPPGGEPTELRSFMRQYSMLLLARLPETISFVMPPTPGDAVNVALDEASLTAILDNLIKNAIEVMPTGGAIKLDWASDPEDAIIEVADDGPGLPDAVVRELQSGGRIMSTKTGGNGLGLLSVQTLLRRAGGDLTVSNKSGTAWLLSVPRAIEADVLETS